MPKKIKKHLLNFLSVTGIYVAVVAGIGIYKLLMGLIGNTDGIQIIEQIAGVIYFLICIGFGWRFYTGVIRDGDFLD
jgi:high-affinity Fe2+/Pb2+ permease